MTAAVRVEDLGAVRHVILSNPKKKNALTRSMLQELADAVAAPRAPGVESLAVPSPPPDAASPASAARVIVISGDPAGGAFSAGFDLSSLDDDERARGLDPIERPASAIESSSVPVIAAVEGHVFGGALELLASCHIRVASREGRFCMPAARLGLMYTPRGIRRFLRCLAPSRAARVLLVGDMLDGQHAYELGLVDELVAHGGAVPRALELARIVAENAPLAVAGMLAAIRCLAQGASATDEAPEALEALEASRARTLASADLREGVAFHDKRRPCFVGA